MVILYFFFPRIFHLMFALGASHIIRELEMGVCHETENLLFKANLNVIGHQVSHGRATVVFRVRRLLW